MICPGDLVFNQVLTADDMARVKKAFGSTPPPWLKAAEANNGSGIVVSVVRGDCIGADDELITGPYPDSEFVYVVWSNSIGWVPCDRLTRVEEEMG